MTNIRKLPTDKLKMRYCPKCRYVMAQEAIEQARFNFVCPRCRARKLSDFKPFNP